MDYMSMTTNPETSLEHQTLFFCMRVCCVFYVVYRNNYIGMISKPGPSLEHQALYPDMRGSFIIYVIYNYLYEYH